jgi:Protein of unknown function (DUF3892)
LCISHSFEIKKGNMATRHEIKCINKPDRNSQVDSITHVGGVNSNGTRWKQTTALTIKEIEDKTAEFFVRVNNNTVAVFVVTGKFGKYLRTEPDHTKMDNLLSLPECPL